MIEFLGKNKIFTENFLHQMQSDDTIESVAQQYNISVEQIKQTNSKDNFKCGKCIVLCDNTKQYHIVKPCETFESIAKMHGITIDELKQKNRVKTLFIGARLLL